VSRHSNEKQIGELWQQLSPGQQKAMFGDETLLTQERQADLNAKAMECLKEMDRLLDCINEIHKDSPFHNKIRSLVDQAKALEVKDDAE